MEHEKPSSRTGKQSVKRKQGKEPEKCITIYNKQQDNMNHNKNKRRRGFRTSL